MGEIDRVAYPGMLTERFAHGDARKGERQVELSAVCAEQQRGPRHRQRHLAHELLGVGQHVLQPGKGPVPLEHREFRLVQRAELLAAADARDLEDPRQPRDEQALHV